MLDLNEQDAFKAYLLNGSIVLIAEGEDPRHAHSNCSVINDINIDGYDCGVVFWIGPSRRQGDLDRAAAIGSLQKKTAGKSAVLSISHCLAKIAVKTAISSQCLGRRH